MFWEIRSGPALIAEWSNAFKLTLRCLLLKGPALIAEWSDAFKPDWSLSLTTDGLP